MASDLKIGQSIYEYNNYNGTSWTPNISTQNQLSWLNNITLPLGSLLLVYDFNRETINKSLGYDKSERNNSGYMVGYLLNRDNHNLQLNYRADDNSAYGKFNTGNIGYGYNLNNISIAFNNNYNTFINNIGLFFTLKINNIINSNLLTINDYYNDMISINIIHSNKQKNNNDCIVNIANNYGLINIDNDYNLNNKKEYDIEILINAHKYYIYKITEDMLNENAIFIGLVIDKNSIFFHINDKIYDFKRLDTREITIDSPFYINKNLDCDITLYSNALLINDITINDINKLVKENKYLPKKKLYDLIYFLQEYITRPMLYKNLKFHLRGYFIYYKPFNKEKEGYIQDNMTVFTAKKAYKLGDFYNKDMREERI